MSKGDDNLAPGVHVSEPQLTLRKRFSVRTLVRICDSVGGDLSRDTALLVVGRPLMLPFPARYSPPRYTTSLR